MVGDGLEAAQKAEADAWVKLEKARYSRITGDEAAIRPHRLAIGKYAIASDTLMYEFFKSQEGK